MLLCPVRLGQYRNRFKFFLLQTGIDRGQFLVRQLAEIRNHVFQFVAKRVRARHLVIGGSAFILFTSP